MHTNKAQTSAMEMLTVIIACITILLVIGIFSGEKTKNAFEQSYISLYSRRILDVVMNYEYMEVPMHDYISMFICGESGLKEIIESNIKEITDYYSLKKDFSYVIWTSNGELKICDSGTDCNEKIIVKDVVEADYKLNLTCGKESSLKIGLWNYR
ncbi:MAG: hypothetical protein PHW96_01485 [Candidatus Nanoarchaeia archaeon]|nr:hypothetical protein [Candidatus Nanoarchaeia archaeon]